LPACFWCLGKVQGGCSGLLRASDCAVSLWEGHRDGTAISQPLLIACLKSPCSQPLLRLRVTLATLIKYFTSLSSKNFSVSSLPHDLHKYLHKHAALYPCYAPVDTFRHISGIVSTISLHQPTSIDSHGPIFPSHLHTVSGEQNGHWKQHMPTTAQKWFLST